MNEVENLLEENNIPFTSGLAAKKHCNYRGGGEISTAVYPQTVEHLRLISGIINATDTNFCVIGGFTNTLVRDSGYKGLAIFTSSFKGVWADGTVLKAGAAERLPRLAAAALGNALSGLECISNIPASLGGAICMNAGAFGTETRSVVQSVTSLDLQTGILHNDIGADIPWGYRNTADFFKDRVIISACLALKLGKTEDIQSKMCTLRRMRIAAQPAAPSLGCAFKNPGGMSAGYYIDSAGLKGTRSGGAGISEKHANFIINMGGGTAEDYIALTELVQTTVKQSFGITLEREIKIIG
ncbi:MAG: UDP-N-acetylmuramate dehydrogenase [Clostridia bacterium]